MSCVPILLVVVPGNSIKNRTSRSPPGQRRNGQLPVTFGIGLDGYLGPASKTRYLDDLRLIAVVSSSSYARVPSWVLRGDRSKRLGQQRQQLGRIVLDRPAKELLIYLAHVPGDDRCRCDLDGDVIKGGEHGSYLGVGKCGCAEIFAMNFGLAPLRGVAG